MALGVGEGEGVDYLREKRIGRPGFRGVEGDVGGSKKERGVSIQKAKGCGFDIHRRVGGVGLGVDSDRQERGEGVDIEVDGGAVRMAYKQERVGSSRLVGGRGRKGSVRVGRELVEVVCGQSGGVGLCEEGGRESLGNMVVMEEVEGMEELGGMVAKGEMEETGELSCLR